MNEIISLEIYPFDVMISVGESNKELRASLFKYGIQETKNWKYKRNEKAKTSLFKDNQILLRIKKVPSSPEDYNWLQHEIFHVVSLLLNLVGIKLSIGSSDEAYAYLIGYLTEKIYTLFC